MRASEITKRLDEQKRHDRIRRPVLDQTRGVGVMLANQRWTQDNAELQRYSSGLRGGSAMKWLGLAFDGADGKRVADGVVRSQALVDIANSTHLAPRVVKSPALVDIAGTVHLAQGVAKSLALMNGARVAQDVAKSRALTDRWSHSAVGLRQLSDANRDVARAAARFATPRASVSTSPLDARTMLRLQDIITSTAPSVRVAFAHTELSARMNVVGQQVARAMRGYAGVGDFHKMLPRGQTALHEAVAGLAAVANGRDLYGRTGLSAASPNALIRPWTVGNQALWAAGLANQVTLRRLMPGVGASPWTTVYGDVSALQRLVREATRVGALA